MSYQNYSLAQLQQIDAAHHLHPFTDHKELRAAGSRIVTRAEGPFIYDSEGNELLDGMAGVWRVDVTSCPRRTAVRSWMGRRVCGA